MSVFSIIWVLLLLSFYGQTDYFYIQSAKGAGRQIEILVTALEFLGRDIGRYPTTQEGFNILMYKPKNLHDQWKGPYLLQEDLRSHFKSNAEIRDVWGTQYIYHSPAQYEKGKAYELYSCGKNKEDNRGQGDDITSWRGADMRYYADEKSFILNNYFDKVGMALIFIIPFIMIMLIFIKKSN